MRIIIYGINEDTINIINCVKKNIDIVAICDSFFNEESIWGYNFIKLSELSKDSADYIIVCVKTRSTYETIKKLLNDKGIEPNKVLSFRNLYYESRLDQVMLYSQICNRTIDGLIIGISHAAYAINPNCLSGNWVNIAVPSEDLVNHNYVIDKLKNEYKEQILNVKRVIIDLYDYTVLNFITSNSRYCVEFFDLYCGDAIEKQINYLEIEKQIAARNNYSSSYARNYRKIRQEIFDDKVAFCYFRAKVFSSPTPIDFFYKDCIDCDKVIDKNAMEDSIKFIPRVQRDENIEGNIEQLYKLIDNIYEINSKMEIYFVLIPRISEVEKETNNAMSKYKNKLYQVIEGVIQKYKNIKFYDYKGVNSISEYIEGYCSAGHLNNSGQVYFSTILNKDIQIGHESCKDCFFIT